MSSIWDYLNTLNPAGTGKHASNCCCPACVGLECLERPRYFAGQLLTEAELNSEQAYALAKSRLHNRYLHGWGVVCGLQVVCHDCDGWLTVKRGYAIDPCGNDIVLCEDHDLDVIKRIRECCEAERRRRRAGCDPIQPVKDQYCSDIEEHWCLTLTYEEKEARPTTALRQERGASCGCGCGGNGRAGRCGCGCHSQRSGKAMAQARSSVQVQSGVGKVVAACEPTRIIEGYRLDVVKSPPEFCQHEEVSDVLLENTLLGKIVACAQKTQDYINQRVPSSDMTLLNEIAFNYNSNANYDLGDLHAAACRFRQAIYDLYVQNEMNVRCGVFDVMKQVTCPTPATGDTVQSYVPVIKPEVENLFTLLAQYISDCICLALEPPCAPDPTCERLVLACVTIKNDKIVKICNFSCRKHAGAFPSLYYWLSLVPIIPLIAEYVAKTCCFGMITVNSPVKNNLFELLNKVDPTGEFRRAFAADQFAMPREQASNIKEKIKNAPLAALNYFVRGPQEEQEDFEFRTEEPQPELEALKRKLDALEQEVKTLKAERQADRPAQKKPSSRTK